MCRIGLEDVSPLLPSRAEIRAEDKTPANDDYYLSQLGGKKMVNQAEQKMSIAVVAAADFLSAMTRFADARSRWFSALRITDCDLVAGHIATRLDLGTPTWTKSGRHRSPF